MHGVDCLRTRHICFELVNIYLVGCHVLSCWFSFPVFVTALCVKYICIHPIHRQTETCMCFYG